MVNKKYLFILLVGKLHKKLCFLAITLARNTLIGIQSLKFKIMIMTGLAIAGLAGSLASSIFGGAASKRAARRAARQLEQEKADNAAWYRRKYNENYIDTAAGQNMMRVAREAARENWQKASGAAAVAGGTDAATAMAKDAGNRMVGNAVANIAANDTARKDNADAAYRAEESRLTAQQIQNQKDQAAAISQAASGASDAFMSGAALAASGAFGSGSKLASMGTDMTQAGKNYEMLSGIDKSQYPYLYGNLFN